MSITPAQCRAGRGLIGWSQQQLAKAAGVGLSTVRGLETGRHIPVDANMRAIEAALEAAGVAFTNGEEPGVKMVRR